MVWINSVDETACENWVRVESLYDQSPILCPRNGTNCIEQDEMASNDGFHCIMLNKSRLSVEFNLSEFMKFSDLFICDQ